MTDTNSPSNLDEKTVASFGDEWSKFNQSALEGEELAEYFDKYFGIFPWQDLPENSVGFDMGCGSGRWAKLVAERVGKLNCVDASPDALNVARKTLAGARNAEFIEGTANSAPLAAESQDFGYSLGVLHHIPDTLEAMKGCVKLLKPGAPFLVYLYYRFDNRPAWFRLLWKVSEIIRAAVSRMPAWGKNFVTDLLALAIYWPLARLARLGEKVGIDTSNWPLYFYRNSGLYTMRTDSRDRFGTPLEQRFTRDEIRRMMEESGLQHIRFSDQAPFWIACGTKVV